MDASWPTEKIERRPAGKAELAIVANDDPATRAARGQRIIDDRAHRGAQASEPCFRRRIRFFGIPHRTCHNSDKRRVGERFVSTFRFRRSPDHYNKKKNSKQTS